MKITDLRCAVIGQNPIIRIVTDEGISGYGEIESSKDYLKPHVMYKRYRTTMHNPQGSGPWLHHQVERLAVARLEETDSVLYYFRKHLRHRFGGFPLGKH